MNGGLDDEAAELAAIALRAALRAGGLLTELAIDRRSLVDGAESKSSASDLVTEADRGAERAILEFLAEERPDDGVLAEEGSSRPSRSGITWVIDPLDGTTNFVYGFGSFAVSIAAVRGDTTVAGVVHDPLLNQTFVASLGAGATYNGEPIPNRRPPPIDLALVGTGFGYLRERRRAQASLLPGLIPAVRDIRRSGTAAIDLCSVALGRLDAYYESGLAPWDRAAGQLIAEECGCRAMDLDDLVPDGATLVVAREPLHGELVGLLRRAATSGDVLR